MADSFLDRLNAWLMSPPRPPLYSTPRVADYTPPQPNQENVMTVKRFLARQGDVMVREVNPATYTRLQEAWEAGQVKITERDNNRVVLAYGEVTGHAHAFHSPKVTMFAADGPLSGRYIKVDEPAALTHEEHDAIEVPVGIYEVVGQREYDDSVEIERARRVAD
jgi:hypothetical protein